MFSGQYATVVLLSEEASHLPGGALAGWLSTLAQQSLVAAILFLLLLFPTGRLPSPRWRAFALFAMAVFVTWLVSEALGPHPLEDFAPTPNPFGVEAAAAVLDLLDTTGGWMGVFCFVGAVLSVIVRFHRLRRGEDARGVLCQAARRDRPRRLERGSRERGEGDCAAGGRPRVAPRAWGER